MAKSSNKKADPVAKHHSSEGKTEVRVQKHDAFPNAKSKHSGRGWEIVDHSPIPADPIVGDPNAPENIIQGKRVRKAVNLNEIEESDPVPAATNKTKGPAKPKGGKKKVAEQDEEVPIPQKRGVLKPRPVLEEGGDDENKKNDATKEAGTTEAIHPSILGLVSQSLQVVEDVLSYMRRVAGQEEQSRGLERDVDAALHKQMKRRKAETQTGRSGKVVKFM